MFLLLLFFFSPYSSYIRLIFYLLLQYFIYSSFFLIDFILYSGKIGNMQLKFLVPVSLLYLIIHGLYLLGISVALTCSNSGFQRSERHIQFTFLCFLVYYLVWHYAFSFHKDCPVLLRNWHKSLKLLHLKLT